MSFDNEEDAFCAYAKAMPNNCVFLVDTYGNRSGIEHSIRQGEWLREHGHKPTIEAREATVTSLASAVATALRDR